jgi:hypothetical protein
VNSLGAFLSGRRVEEPHALLPEPPKVLDQRDMGDEFLVRAAFHSNSPQLGPEDQSVDRRFGEQSGPSASRRKGYVETRLGRRWHWSWRAMDPETLPEDIPFRDDLLIGFSKPLSLNFPIQGSTSEIMLLALVNTHRALKGSSAKLIATVHDAKAAVIVSATSCLISSTSGVGHSSTSSSASRTEVGANLTTVAILGPSAICRHGISP